MSKSLTAGQVTNLLSANTTDIRNVWAGNRPHLECMKLEEGLRTLRYKIQTLTSREAISYAIASTDCAVECSIVFGQLAD